MDILKRKTIKDYTVWDLNCPWVVNRAKEGRQLIKIIKRKARRQLKQELRKELEQNE